MLYFVNAISNILVRSIASATLQCCPSFVYVCSHCRYELDIKCTYCLAGLSLKLTSNRSIAWWDFCHSVAMPLRQWRCQWRWSISFSQELHVFTTHCQDCKAWSSPRSHLIWSRSSKQVNRLAGEIVEFVKIEVNREYGGYYCPDCNFVSHGVVQYQFLGQWACPIESELTYVPGYLVNEFSFYNY